MKEYLAWKNGDCKCFIVILYKVSLISKLKIALLA